MTRKITSALVAAFVTLSALSFSAPARAQFADQKQYAPTSGGTANAQTIAIANMPATVPQGVPFWFKPSAPNTTTATLKIGNATALPLAKPSPAGAVALTGGELQIGQIVQVQSDGTNLIITSSVNSTAASIFVTPQGYLTPCNFANSPSVTGCVAGNLVPTGDVSGTTALYYQPTENGNQIPIWNGTQMVVFQFPELTLTLGTASNLANVFYDVCVTTTTAGAYAVNGTPTLVTSVAWTTSTLGSGARGSGASSAQITRTNGIWTNAVQIDGKNGATTYSAIPANRCTIVGTLLVDASNGQASFHRTAGTLRRWAFSNIYNKQPIVLQVQDGTGSWTGTTSGYRASNGTTNNSGIAINSVAEETVSVTFQQYITGGTNGTSATQAQVFIGIGINGTTSAPAAASTQGVNQNFNTSGGSLIFGSTPTASLTQVPGFGGNQFIALENSIAGTSNNVYFGSTNMNMRISWRG